MKTCPDCGVTKPLDDFPRHRSMPDGRARYCRPCMNLRSRESYQRRQARRGQVVREREDLPTGWKRCPDCDEVQPLEAFPRNKRSKDGRHSYCKPCHNARGQETRQRLYGGSRHYHLVRRYAISAAEADRMLEAQGGLCAICGENAAEHVDHCHDSGTCGASSASTATEDSGSSATV